jgi:hypothetical protein
MDARTDNAGADTGAALKFITSQFEHTDGPVNVCVLKNDGGGAGSTLTTRDPAKIESFIRRQDKPGHGIYFCVSTISGEDKIHAKENAVELAFAHADTDMKDIINETPESALAKIRALEYPPSRIVWSGHGFHSYWLFNQPHVLPIDGTRQAAIEEYDNFLGVLCDFVGGDTKPAHVAGLMRVVGTHNTKGGEWNTVDVVEDNGRRYELSALQEWQASSSPKFLRKRRAREHTAGQSNAWEQFAKNCKAPVDVEQRLSAMVYMGGNDAAIHGTQVSVTASMLNAGIAIDEVVSLVLGATRAAAGDYGARWNWNREQKAIRGMCDTWLKKHPQASDKPQASVKGFPLEHYENFGATVSKSWIIKNVIAVGETSSWIGAPGAGKSALITDLMVHIALGKDWRGHRSKETCGVVYIALERGELVKRRLIALAKQTLGFAKKLPFSIARQVIDLVKPACVEQIIATINSAAEFHGCRIGVIVIDTYAKGIAAGGGDENSAKDQNMTLANLRRVQEATGVHIAIIGHTGKDENKGPRGSNAFVGDVDMMVQFSGDKDQRIATIVKNNDGAEGLLTRYTLEVAVLGKDEDGDDITTAIISADELISEKDISRANLNKTQRKAMEMLERAIVDDGREVPISSEYPQGVGKMVTLDGWKACCIKGGLSAAGTKESTDKAFRRVVSDLDGMHRIGVWEGNVWIAYE